MFKWSAIFLLLGISAFANGAKPEPCNEANAQTPAAQAPTLLVLGDSLSSGWGIKLEQSWVSLLQTKLHQEGHAYQVFNASISGATTSGGLARLEQALQKHKPSVVIIGLGGNDGLRGLPLEVIEQNLTAMIERNIAANAQTVLLGIRIPSNYGPRYAEKFHQLYTELATQYHLPLVDFFMEGVALNPELMQADGIHPNAEAQARLLANAWPTIERSLIAFSDEAR